MIGAMLGLIPPARNLRELLTNVALASGAGLVFGYALAFAVAAGFGLAGALS